MRLPEGSSLKNLRFGGATLKGIDFLFVPCVIRVDGFFLGGGELMGNRGVIYCSQGKKAHREAQMREMRGWGQSKIRRNLVHTTKGF